MWFDPSDNPLLFSLGLLIVCLAWLLVCNWLFNHIDRRIARDRDEKFIWSKVRKIPDNVCLSFDPEREPNYGNGYEITCSEKSGLTMKKKKIELGVYVDLDEFIK